MLNWLFCLFSCPINCVKIGTDLKIDNLVRVSIPAKIVASFDVEQAICGTTNDHAKSVNIGKISTALYVFYLNLNLLAQTVQIAQIQAYSFECTPCSDAISGSKNRLFDIKSGHGVETLSRLSIFRSVKNRSACRST